MTNNKGDGTKQMMKNIKTFGGSNKAECITWLSQTEAASKFSNLSFKEILCQGMAPSMRHVLTELSATAMDQEIKDVILTNLSDIPGTAKVAARLQNLQMKVNEPLVTYNTRYQAIHQVAFGLQPTKQYDRTAIVKYTKKLPQFMKEKLLRKIAKENSYIRTLDDAFKQAREIDRENSFVDAASGRCNEQIPMKAQKPLELMQTVRNFINFMKTCPASREQFKSNKIAQRNFQNEVNESEIHTSSLEQVQQLINEDTDLVFDTLVAAGYIDEIECMDGNNQATD